MVHCQEYSLDLHNITNHSVVKMLSLNNMARISFKKQNHRTKHETHVIYENIIGTRLKEV